MPLMVAKIVPNLYFLIPQQQRKASISGFSKF